jgi:hypothetical protein
MQPEIILAAMTRTDTHRPSEIQPTDYDFVGFEYLRVDDLCAAQMLIAERARIRAHMQRTGGTYSGHQHGGNCHICGAAAIYTALFYHAATNSYVRTGLECAEKLDCGEVDRFRREVRTALEQRAGKRKAIAVLAQHSLDAAWQIFSATEQAGYQREENTVCDIVGRLVQYGSISDGQISYLRTLVDRIARRPEILAQREAENAAAAPLPVTGERIAICGTVLSVKLQEFGPPRMLVRHAAGWKVFGTVPAALSDLKAGDAVEFHAAIKPSKNDAKFGFFSRPTKAKLVPAA